MQFFDIGSIELDSVSRELIDDAYSLQRQINEFRPLSDALIDNIQRELLGERVFNSNAIEGNTLSLRETEAILEAGQIADVGRRREGQEAINLGRAIEHLQTLVNQQDSFSEKSELLIVHNILLKEIDDDWAGRYRNARVMLRGAKHQPPDFSEISGLMDDFFLQLKSASKIEPILVASWVHWAIARIHPFFDGNGRIARLWQDLILFSNRFVPAMIRQDQRKAYYKALESADDGHFDSLVQLVTYSLTNTLQVYVNAQQEEDVISGWASEIVGEVDERIDDQRKLEYKRWCNHMEFLRDAFQRCAGQINKASDGKLFIEVSSYPIIEKPTWEILRAGTGASNTWFFRVFGRMEDITVHYIFFFGHHFRRDEDIQVGEIGSTVCLLISEQIGKDDPERLIELRDFPITIRELFVLNNRIVRKRWDRERESVIFDDNVQSLTVAQDFLKEVVFNRLSI